MLKSSMPDESLKLLIVGEGSLKDQLKELTVELNVDADTVFTGKIEHSEIPDYHNMLDISVSLSILDSESFGVAIVEAMACAVPVVVTRVGGLPEVVSDKETGLVVEPNNPESASSAIEWLLQHKNEAKEMGQKARLHVVENYNWETCVQKMIDYYSLPL